MQQTFRSTRRIHESLRPGRRRRFGTVGLALILVVFSAGCIDRSTTIDEIQPAPHEGTTLRIAVADPFFRPMVEDLARGWANRRRAKVEVVAEGSIATPDVLIIPPERLGEFAPDRKCRELPKEALAAGHFYRSADLMGPYMLRVLHWNDRPLAVSLAAEGAVLLCRGSAFDGKDGRPAAPPATWSDMQALAAKFGNGSLAPCGDLVREFGMISAAYDRPAAGRGTNLGGRQEFFSFQFHASDGKSRIAHKPFEKAAQLLSALQPLRSTAPSAVQAFGSEQCRMGIVTLAELHAIVSAYGPEPFIVHRIPGAYETYGDTGEPRPVPQGGVNRVPYYGWGGCIGIVSQDSTAADAGWDFLIESAHPERDSLDLISAGRWGAGVSRAAHLDGRLRSYWLGYKLNHDQTTQLLDAVRTQLGLDIQNPRAALRTPNQAELSGVLRTQLQAIAGGKTSAIDGLKIVDREWNARNAKLGPNWLSFYRTSLGL